MQSLVDPSEISDATLIATRDVPSLWSRVAPLLARAAARPTCHGTLEDVYAGLCDGSRQLWIACERSTGEIMAAMATEIVTYDQLRVLRILLVGGTALEAWLGWLPALEQWAREWGCEIVEFIGRPGWGRVCGYADVGRVFQKRLVEEVRRG